MSEPDTFLLGLASQLLSTDQDFRPYVAKMLVCEAARLEAERTGGDEKELRDKFYIYTASLVNGSVQWPQAATQ